MKAADGRDGAVGATTGLRMRDLTRETGLTREAIHFYITQGLLPRGTKTGRNTAEYGREHLLRLQRIRELQAQHFLPLRAIKALLEDELSDENLTPEQEALLARVRATLPDLGQEAERSMTLAEAVGGRISRSELAELRDAGIVEVTGRGGAARVSAGTRRSCAPGPPPATRDSGRSTASALSTSRSTIPRCADWSTKR